MLSSCVLNWRDGKYLALPNAWIDSLKAVLEMGAWLAGLRNEQSTAVLFSGCLRQWVDMMCLSLLPTER